MHRLVLVALVGASVSLSACGGDDEVAVKRAAAPGSPERPMMAKLEEETAPTKRTNEAAGPATEAPSYATLLERQKGEAAPESAFTPCNLVTPKQAEAILGERIATPKEAPQGPTCIYRGERGRSFVTVAVLDQRLAALKGQLRGRRPVSISSRPAYCGVHGQPMLYAELSDGRVLAIAARCVLARKFALKAVQQLEQ